MSEKLCEKCKSAGPFTTVSGGRRCQQCGAIEAHPAPAKYEQVPDPPPLNGSDVRKIGPYNPMGM
jgi:rRNA maturation protein Nop10